MATRIRQKAEERAQNKDNRPYAVAKDIRMSSSKVRIVLDNIRGKKANEAVAILTYMPQAGAKESLKVLKSAIANAENNKGLSSDNLYVAECYSTPGALMKRISFRARGRADRILKRTCHITVVLDELKEAK
jgi:large subunit ribosomal protein L22